MVTLKAFPPTTWCRCVEGICPGFTSLKRARCQPFSHSRSTSRNLRVQPLDNQLRAGEAERGSSDGPRHEGAGSDEEWQSQVHLRPCLVAAKETICLQHWKDQQAFAQQEATKVFAKLVSCLRAGESEGRRILCLSLQVHPRLRPRRLDINNIGFNCRQPASLLAMWPCKIHFGTCSKGCRIGLRSWVGRQN